MTKKPSTHKVFPINHCRCGKLPLIVTGAAWAHRHLNHAHPGAKIATETLKVVSDAAMVPATIRDLLQRGETEHPGALETVVIVSEMYDDEHNVIAGVVAVALAHALPVAVPRRRVADGVETVSVSSACGAAAVRENLMPKKRSEVGHG